MAKKPPNSSITRNHLQMEADLSSVVLPRTSSLVTSALALDRRICSDLSRSFGSIDLSGMLKPDPFVRWPMAGLRFADRLRLEIKAVRLWFESTRWAKGFGPI
ncbi:MAG: hypothetical protein IPP40_06160 [bacterium]|nr:hypothetical protein [bacterium]